MPIKTRVFVTLSMTKELEQDEFEELKKDFFGVREESEGEDGEVIESAELQVLEGTEWKTIDSFKRPPEKGA